MLVEAIERSTKLAAFWAMQPVFVLRCGRSSASPAGLSVRWLPRFGLPELPAAVRYFCAIPGLNGCRQTFQDNSLDHGPMRIKPARDRVRVTGGMPFE